MWRAAGVEGQPIQGQDLVLDAAHANGLAGTRIAEAAAAKWSGAAVYGAGWRPVRGVNRPRRQANWRTRADRGR
ncbi:hypothetical protein DMH18_39105 [Streptomyces sp. WAC 06783]|nr:hypothetical protein DMH18_39105 [Streptomyces sp. WAC 06783]